MNRILLALVGMLAIATAALTVCTTFWSTAFLVADLWMPENTGIFMEGGTVRWAGYLATPRGTKLFPNGMRFASTTVLMASLLVGAQATSTVKTVARKLQ